MVLNRYSRLPDGQTKIDKHLEWKERSCERNNKRKLFNLKYNQKIKTIYIISYTKTISSILSKLDYCNLLFRALPLYIKNQMQRVQNAAYGSVLKTHININDIIKYKLLPKDEQIEHSFLKLSHKSIYEEFFPSYMKLQVKEYARTLRSNEQNYIEASPSDGT